ncbi:MAG TPA: hypothetical protein ENL07_11060 [Chlorobaculum parvum]|uniref:Uncharacterized protein n=1 Tax=Chlorobaculum parvum TaxID=274539 RepID=A0A7C5HKS9_9CHLB|nr:hypothetical protein [Chlorobaculum parvum]
MLKFILLLIALWLAVRFVSRLIRMTFTFSRDDRFDNRPESFSSSNRRVQVEETDYEVIDSHIKQKE